MCSNLLKSVFSDVFSVKPESKHISALVNFLKLLLLFGTFGFIFYKLFYAYHLGDLIDEFKPLQFGAYQIFAIIVVVVLMCFNWMLEASKWHLLIKKYEFHSYYECLKSVLSGVTLSILTPNQIGDFAGRVIFLKQFDKIKGSLVVVVGHTAQMLMTAAFGSYAFVWLFEEQQKISASNALWLYAGILLLTAIAVFAYINIRFLSRLNFPAKIKKYIVVFENYKRSELLKTLLLSFFRYAIFVTQYYLLLQFFGVEIDSERILICIFATFCVQSFAPSFLLIELGVRGASALLFFELFTDNRIGILLSAYTLWIINLMTPALLGLGVILKTKIIKK